jgi:hypothetical protein
MPRGVAVFVAIAVGLAVPLAAQEADPRTAAGQLAACGGAAGWQQAGYVDFQVTVTAAGTTSGPWRYRWDRRNGFLRFTGPGADQALLDLALEVSSRSGGGWRAGKQLTGKLLREAVDFALTRFDEDRIWLVFPLEWTALGTTVAPQPDVTTAQGGVYPVTLVQTSGGAGEVWLDPESGRVRRTVLRRAGARPVVATWDGWQSHGGVFFAERRTLGDGGVIETKVLAVAVEAPPDAF